MFRLMSERLLLRDFDMEDWPAVQAYAERPEVYRYQPSDPPDTPEKARNYLAHVRADAGLRPRLDYTLAIVLAVSDGAAATGAAVSGTVSGAAAAAAGAVIGAANLTIHSRAQRSGEIGYFVHPDYWKHGYATETARRLLAFGFGDLRLHRIFAMCDPRNTASERVMQRAGMQYEGHLRHTLLIHDGWRDSLVYSILEDEWVDPGGK
jgi:[ribosomal protein S5]-alanine N-acetyltransferase